MLVSTNIKNYLFKPMNLVAHGANQQPNQEAETRVSFYLQNKTFSKKERKENP